MGNNPIKLMNKKGIEIVTGTLILVGLIVFGGLIYSSEKVISENRFVGDINTNLYYDLKECSINHVEKNNLRNFKSEKEALENGFQPASCSR